MEISSVRARVNTLITSMTSDFRPKTFSGTLRWRRLVITIAVLAVGLVLWVRHQRVEGFRTEVALSVEALMRNVENGVPAYDSDAVRRLVLQTAHFELGRLWTPVKLGPVRVGDAEVAEAMVVVEGDVGGRVQLRWQGMPPVLVGVERLGNAPATEQPMEEMQR